MWAYVKINGRSVRVKAMRYRKRRPIKQEPIWVNLGLDSRKLAGFFRPTDI